VSKLKSFRDLRVYQELKRLHLEVHNESLKFPKFEMYELGSQIRRSSNSAPAMLAEGWGSRHTNIYMESVNRAMGEVRETLHHLEVAERKGYLPDEAFQKLEEAYSECYGMLENLYQSLSRWRDSKRTGNAVQENAPNYQVTPADEDWQSAVEITFKALGGKR